MFAFFNTAKLEKMKQITTTSEAVIKELLTDIRKYDDLMLKDEFITLTNSVQQFKNVASFKTLLDTVLNDARLLGEILKNSYRHHNGFHKIVLSKGALFKLRLHIFTSIPEVQVPMENIHNHRWNFASQIIEGRLRMEIFQKSDNPTAFFFNHDYMPANGADNYQVNLLGLSGLELTEERVIKAGENYYMACDELHRIVNYPNETVVTVIMTGAPTNQQCKLYSAQMFIDEQKEILRYNRNEIVTILEKLA